MGGKIKYYEEQFMEHVTSGEFSVDSEGRIWKHIDLRRGHGVLNPPRRAEKGKDGNYKQVGFQHNGRRLMGTAHRIVYRAIKGIIPDGYEVNHDDGVKDNNHPDNLLPETASGNVKHAYRTGLKDEPIEQQIAELKSAGWVPLTLRVWENPSGGVFIGPHGAWLRMMSRKKTKNDPFDDCEVPEPRFVPYVNPAYNARVCAAVLLLRAGAAPDDVRRAHGMIVLREAQAKLINKNPGEKR